MSSHLKNTVAGGLTKPGPQSRALCGAVCALSIATVLYKLTYC